jgi:hypothetical protein
MTEHSKSVGGRERGELAAFILSLVVWRNGAAAISATDASALEEGLRERQGEELVGAVREAISIAAFLANEGHSAAARTLVNVALGLEGALDRAMMSRSSASDERRLARVRQRISRDQKSAPLVAAPKSATRLRWWEARAPQRKE